MSTEIGRVLGQRYRIVTPIGMGASARVFLADDARLRRRVAVKMLHEALADDADFLRRFRAEARAAAALSHPNVVAVYDWGDDDVAFIVTEFLAGGSLRALLDGGALLTVGQTLLVGLEAARALDYAHRRGFVHRDIKPANLLFGEEGRLRVADFGLARALAEAAWTEPQGAMLGTARYASPEQAMGLQLTGKADVYSLALVLIEAVTGQVPFTADTPLGTLMARINQPLEVPDALGPLRRVLERAGASDPADRIDARTMAGGLLAAAEQLSQPEALPLAGAFPRTDASIVDDDPTLHGPVGADNTARDSSESGDVIDLREDDLDLDPPDWVSSAEPLVAFTGAGVEGLGPGEPEADDGPDDPPSDADGELLEPTILDLTGADRSPDSSVGNLLVAPPVIGAPLNDRSAADDSETSAVAQDPLAGKAVGAGATAAVPVSPTPRGSAVPPPDGDADPAERRRRRWPWLAVLFLALAAVATATVLLLTDRTADRTPTVPTFSVPNLSQRSVPGARVAVARFRWRLVVSHARRDGTKAGRVIRTVPPVGARLQRGGRLRLIVSDGNTLAVVPSDLARKPLAAARAELLRSGLGSAVAGRFDEKVAKGVVIGLASRTPARLPKEQIVKLVVSDGPKPRLVPGGLTGATEAEAALRLTAVQLRPASTQAFSDTVRTGKVISVRPDSGTSAPRGSTVTLVVSKGPDLVTVPSLSGVTSINGAITVLRGAGLTAGNVNGPAAGRPRTTTPGAGTRVRRNSTVDIQLG